MGSYTVSTMKYHVVVVLAVKGLIKCFNNIAVVVN